MNSKASTEIAEPGNGAAVTIAAGQPYTVIATNSVSSATSNAATKGGS